MSITQYALVMRRRFPVVWRMARRYRMPSDDAGQPYYFEWDLRNWNTFDRRGVPFDGRFYNPVTIAEYALQLHQRLYRGNASARVPFLTQADFLVNAQREDGAYPYAFALPRWGVAPGWISAMAQGGAASVLFRAYMITGHDEYQAAALRALAPLQTDVSAGGASLIRDGFVFFEEFAAQPCHVLNGHLFAAFAVWEACQFGNAGAGLRSLHERAMQTLIQWLPLYDDNGWSYYQLAAREGERHYASIFYHHTHIAQLNVFAAMTGCERFRVFADKWRTGLNRVDVRRRVWKDSAKWLAQSVSRRVRAETPTPWRSLLLKS